MPSRVWFRVAALLVVVSSVSGCATPGAQGGGDDPCNPLAAALVGALAGYAVDGSGKGAAAGAGLATVACFAINYSSRQEKSSQQTQAEYQRAHGGKLPEKTTVTSYVSRLAAPSIKPGSGTVLSTTAEVVKGKNDQEPRVEEELVISTPDKQEFKRLRKLAGESGGLYSSRFTISFPTGIDDGVYPITTSLYINDKKMKSANAKLQVVSSGHGGQLVVAGN
jgi:hypothetical protein